MPKFTKKPVNVEAIQLSTSMTIDTPERYGGTLFGRDGDWLVTDDTGRQSFMDPGTFYRTFDKVEGEPEFTPTEIEFVKKKNRSPKDITFYWSRRPGKFVNKLTGEEVPDARFTGTVREWHETLCETMVDVANTLKRKVAEDGGDPQAPIYAVASPDVLTILECSVVYKPHVNPEFVQGVLLNRIRICLDTELPRNGVFLFSQDRSKHGEVSILDMDLI